jgi:ATP-dependent helicase/nuclease subunit A
MTLDLHIRPADPQARAADPRLSAFVTANAGSGKTKTLIDRVARLLLAGAAPQTILCVTYTKAAAAEMQRRLFGLLGDWSVLPDDELAGRLAKLEGRRFEASELSAARALFARALETPGGLKIQTIHAFCEKLLRRFPIEAGVSPGFQVMDDATAAAVAAAARAGVARHALAGEGAVAEAYARFSVALDFQGFEAMFADFETRRGALGGFFDRVGGLAGAEAWAWRTCGFEAPTDPAAVQDAAMAALQTGLWARAAQALAGGGKQDQDRSRRMGEIAEDPRGRFDAAVRVLFTASGEPAKWVESSAILKREPALQMLLLAEQARLDAACAQVRAAAVAADTATALTLAQAYLAAYRVEKDFAGALDFADLIEKTRALLASRPAAAWVLYKLDGGIDHILVDEAQDTALDQWEIVRALTAEFFAGAGVGGARLERHMFVVGDEKQSIYSFQGAQPEQLIREFEFHRDRALGAGVQFERVDLLTSWRSTPQVLSFVDAVFAPPELAGAIQPRLEPEPVTHLATREGHAGCVDLWDPEVEAKGDERLAWDAPLDAEAETSANRRLAKKIALEIAALIARGDAVFDKDLAADGQKGAWRAANAGDVLILVRRRRALFEEILRALKQEGIPVAGADRLALSEHIVFDDLLAAARFALFPGDDLTLAALLKSPFCGLDDDGLYDLAHGRSGGLWASLQARGGERAEWGEARARLAGLVEAGRALPPFEFYQRLLGLADADGRSMRERILKRLGSEAEDALDEFLAQVLAAEGRGLADLESLADGFARLDITVKREMEAPAGQVRVMTAHGAKGLEAPIVFLPETTLTRTARGSPLMETEGDEDGIRGFLWCSSKDRDCEPSAAARARRTKREEDEAFRLLYVGLTRARDRLVLCGRVSADTKVETLKGWWGAIAAAFEHPDIAPHVRRIEDGPLAFCRFGADPARMPGGTLAPAATAPLPAWARATPAAEAFGRYASPSTLGEDALAPAASPLAALGGLGRFRRGDLIHRLLQVLPDLAPERWDEGAAALLARERDLTDAQRAEMAEAALSVLRDERFAEVFGPGSRAEVAIAGAAAALPAGLKVSGRIDRLVVLKDRVLVADFKTNRPSPARIEAADPAYIRQMAIYAAVLGEVFPGRRIEAALVWTDGPKLMPIPENMLALSLADLSRIG